MSTESREALGLDRLTRDGTELAAKLGVLALLLYWSYVLISPFLTIGTWSVVLCVALYPAYERMVRGLGGRRHLAAALLTVLCLIVIIGPATWLALDLVDSLRALASSADEWSIPSPPPRVKDWPVVGEPLYQFWDLASTNLREAFAKIAPQLKPVGGAMLGMATGAGVGVLKFFAAVIVAGFLFAPAPAFVAAAQKFVLRLASDRGERLLVLAASTIRTVSRGVIGIAFLQSLLAGIGFSMAGIPGASLLTSACLILAIVQIGPAPIIISSIVWAWSALDTTSALLFTAYMVPVNLMDNVLRPLVMARGLTTPMLVILIGVIGGTISYGITGLFLGPIVLAVIWELLMAWTSELDESFGEASPSGEPQ
ncbi:AI-2E family transporter [Rhodoblastus acidophilus]|uniref:AI-2E family transporter n=1 Tax=Rhodoblastus acidophilus TaxID=1074 RepID=A0A6N8DRU9_RHOAC|nr:AI-2E family transporter [Rhodoblastus acidophilus]MCW2272444.1 putative PurR-regulated permease PerM [Rhodoblastus acidophilus]MTV31913.1 AI-2E family transporter [Rhodoblastus acidophilus]